MVGMADRGNRGDGAPRTGRERLRKLTQAALTADETVDQVQEILGDRGEALDALTVTMGSMDTTIGSLDGSLARVSTTMDRIDGMSDRVDDLMRRMEGIVSRVEKIVGVAETALVPVAAVESVGRGVAGIFGLGGKK